MADRTPLTPFPLSGLLSGASIGTTPHAVFLSFAHQVSAPQKIVDGRDQIWPVCCGGSGAPYEDYIEGSLSELRQPLSQRFTQTPFYAVAHDRTALLLADHEAYTQPGRGLGVVAGSPHHVKHRDRIRQGATACIDPSKVPVGAKAHLLGKHSNDRCESRVQSAVRS